MNTSTANGSGAMFDRIAQRYDMMNRIISVGLDRGWRRKLISAVGSETTANVLDVATGTADVAISLAHAYPNAKVVGLDPSAGMLGVGHTKLEKNALTDRITLLEGDAQALPFEDNKFDGACISFGIRNVPDRELALNEMRRVTKPGGKVAVLELGEPRVGPLATFARFHIRHVVPKLGAWLSGEKEYSYLRDSIQAFPAPEAFAEMMHTAGLKDVDITRMTMDTAHLYVGTVPAT